MAESAWDEIIECVGAAPYPVQVLPADPSRARECLARLEISERSWLGAVTLNSGGLTIDHGWLRVLGSGTDLQTDVVSASKPEQGLVLVAYDVLGGHFTWTAAEPGAPPTIHYFALDTLEYEDLERGYADWLHAMLSGAMTEFYSSLRWTGWEAESAAARLDQGIHVFPPPSTVEGKDLNHVSRDVIPLKELLEFNSGIEI
ncbi:hypothetical protein Rhe02_20590 [Rhizocola hellebori]|uniref:DUF2625 family protein n=1 Tax=Rhizocola hellebori TaxID=1392758 RepID=A0A8J3Q5W4_9ACTN|nr:DUF2625 family protein [Rhizocola hellebori]GIH03992.1 hypothetical protein Rhe02_20590 [Rhizocola hellebori]